MIDTGVVPAVHLTPAGVSPTTHPGQTRVNRSLHDNAMALTTGPDGKLAITLPMGDKKLPGIAAEDIGKCARGIFERGAEFIGRSIGIAGEHPTGTEMAAALSRALGQEIVYNAVEPEIYRSFGFPGADDIGNMFQYKHDFNNEYCALRDLELARSLNPELQTFTQWLEQNKSRIPLG